MLVELPILQRDYPLQSMMEDKTILTNTSIASEHKEADQAQMTPSTITPTMTKRTDLDAYLNRPVLIHTINWAENSSISENIYPWRLYFNHPSIKRRIDNYAFLKCNLNVRVLISASPFYYGALQVSYRPFSDEGVCPVFDTDAQQSLCGRSQRPSFNIYPQTSQGGEMKLPFLWHKEYMNIVSSTDIYAIGDMSFRSFDVLRNANSVAGEAATIQVFAWAEDVQLSGPTLALALQSDEYGKGVVSKPASAIALYAGKLSDWPIIGPFATATSIAAGAVSNIASLFGYTNVPNISDQSAFRPTTNPLLATTDIGTAVEKLTIDSKNELTIDNKAYSVGPTDPLEIESICNRETYLTSFTWAATDAPQTLLFNSLVTPSLALDTPITVGPLAFAANRLQLLPMSMVSRLFSYWRGDIKFRFVFVCSQYHRGKARISWDPVALLGSFPSSFTEVFNRVIDLTEETDVTITVPYNQATAFKPTENNPRSNASQFGTAPVVTSTDNNGIIAVTVMNKQTSPVASAPIRVLVYVSAANVDFEAPEALRVYHTPFPLQSSMDKVMKTNEDLFETKENTDHLNLVYMGEKITSLRTLLRRSVHSIGLAPTDFYGANSFIFSIMNRMPLYPGYDPNGVGSASSVGTLGATAPYNFCNYTALNWVSQCFVGYRGSVIWNFNVTGPELPSSILSRRCFTALTAADYIRANTYTPSSESQNSDRALSRSLQTINGATVTNARAQPSLSFLAPWYSQFKFAATTALQRTLGRATFGTNTDSIRTDVIVKNSATNPANLNVIDMYVGAGTDYDPVFFLNVPVMYYTYGLPVPAP